MQRSQIFVQNRVFLPTPPAFDAPVGGPGGGSHRNIAMPFGTEKIRMAWLPEGKKMFEDMFIRLDRIHERDGQTDGQMDKHRMTT